MRRALTLSLILLAGIGVVVIGIGAGKRIALRPTPTPAREGLGITEIILGTPRVAVTSGTTTPPLRQEATYSTVHALALRVTTSVSDNPPFTLSVRLLNEQGAVTELTPSTVTVNPQTSVSGFCCWTVTKAGTYTMQVFRPDGVITTLPLKITPALENAQPQVPIL